MVQATHRRPGEDNREPRLPRPRRRGSDLASRYAWQRYNGAVERDMIIAGNGGGDHHAPAGCPARRIPFGLAEQGARIVRLRPATHPGTPGAVMSGVRQLSRRRLEPAPPQGWVLPAAPAQDAARSHNRVHELANAQPEDATYSVPLPSSRLQSRCR